MPTPNDMASFPKNDHPIATHAHTDGHLGAIVVVSFQDSKYDRDVVLPISVASLDALSKNISFERNDSMDEVEELLSYLGCLIVHPSSRTLDVGGVLRGVGGCIYVLNVAIDLPEGVECLPEAHQLHEVAQSFQKVLTHAVGNSALCSPFEAQVPRKNMNTPDYWDDLNERHVNRAETVLRHFATSQETQVLKDAIQQDSSVAPSSARPGL